MSHRDNLDLTWKHHFNFFLSHICLYKKSELFYFRIFENFIRLDRTHFGTSHNGIQPQSFKIIYYRVSLKTVATFIYWISWLPRGLEIPSWTFFNSPFCVHFRNIQLFIIRWNMKRDIGKILLGEDFKS